MELGNTSLFTLLLVFITSTWDLGAGQDGLCGGDGVHQSWYADDGFCYYIAYDQVSWHQARKNCAAQDSHLVSLRSKEAVNYILDLLMEKPPGVKSLWTGLNALRADGSFAWEDGTLLTLDEWGQSALNNTENAQRNKCVFMDAKDGTWGLGSCNRDEMGYVCMVRNPSWPTESPIRTTSITPVVGNCPEGWTAYGDRCYQLFGKDHPATWLEASRFCKSRNLDTGHLASVHSHADQNFLMTLIDSQTTNAWIGFQKLVIWKEYFWEDQSPSDFVDWSSGKPNTARGDLCVEMLYLLNRPGKWNPLGCGNRRPFICQMSKDPNLTTTVPPPRSKCSGRFQDYKDECYWAVTEFAGQKSWSEAEKTCMALGSEAGYGMKGHLVSVVDPFQQAFLATTFDSADQALWIGFSDKVSEEGTQFLWTDEWPTHFTNWAEGEAPLNISGTRCAAMADQGRWKLFDCEQPRGYVCKATRQSPPEVVRVSGTCPTGGWMDLGTDGCYLVDSKTALPWQDARARCQQMDSSGDLVSIHSAAEMRMLIPLMKEVVDSVWIGLRKYSWRENFGWSDQSPAVFNHWAKGEPNGGWSELCVEMFARDLTWNDVDCSRNMNYICATDKILDSSFCGGKDEHRLWGAIDGVCYHIVSDMKVTWHQAKEECGKRNSKLATFTRREEADYIFNRMKAESTGDLWMGLNALGSDGSFAWDDGTIVTLDEFSDQAERDTDRKKCAFVDHLDGSWGVERCNQGKLGFICAVPKPGYPTKPPPPVTPVEPGYCPKGWTTYGNKCYQLFGKENPVTWGEAQTACRALKNTGHLASVHSLMEQNVLMTLMGVAETNAWIGFRRDGYWMEFTWEDDTPTDYVAWNKGMFTPGLSTLCVEMMYLIMRPGKWNPLGCASKRPYICQMSKDASLTTSVPPEPSSCRDNYLEYKGDCYAATTDPISWNNWLESEDGCVVLEGESGSGLKGHLTSVTDPFQQAFLAVTFASDYPLWIGLSDKVNETSVEFGWTDGWPVYLTNWDEEQPRFEGSDSKCTAMGPGGRWALHDCHANLGYICKATKDKPPEVEKMKGDCPSKEWVDIGTSKCYFIKPNDRIDWEGASEECQKRARNATLASVHSEVELRQLGPHLSDLEKHLWIGLKRDLDTDEFKWSDQSAENYFNWGKGEPSDGWMEDCVELFAHDMTWNDRHCNQPNGYICAVDKYPDDGPCGGEGPQSNWTSIGGFCYDANLKAKVTWHDAREACADSGGFLASFRHGREIDRLLVLIAKQNPKVSKLWIGLNALGADGSFVWDDGTPLTMDEWGEQAIADNLDRKKCAFMTLEDGSWGLERCNQGKLGFVCMARKPGWPTEAPPTTPRDIEGNCPAGWITHGNKCFRVFGKEEPQTWDQAKSFCRSQNGQTGHLASAHDDIEQAVLTSMIGSAGVNAWIGLRREGWSGDYLWEDETDTNFVNWNKGMHVPGSSMVCVEIMSIMMRAGKWNLLPCSDMKPFICQMYKEKSVTTPEPTAHGDCPEQFVGYNEDCYGAVVATSALKTWKEAETACASLRVADGQSAHLVSVVDHFQHAFLTHAFAYSQALWIGYSEQGGSRFQWSDKWPTVFTAWGKGQPELNESVPQCAAVTTGGHWSVYDCQDRKGYICRITRKTPPKVEWVDGICPPGGWIDVGTPKCYFIERKDNYQWDSASKACQGLAPTGNLLSLHSKHELDLLSPHLANLEAHLWIGLRRDHTGESFTWIDQSPEDFFHWGKGEPSDGWNEDCVELYAHDLTWNDNQCYKSRGYICAADKTPAPTPTTTEEIITEPTSCGPALEGWTYHKGYCYFLQEQRDGATDWHSSEKFCNDMGGHLVSIHDDEENKFVFDLLEQRNTEIFLWSGFHAFGSDSGFSWTDGSSALYDRMSKAALGQGRCVALNPQNREWVPNHCSRKLGLVCKHTYGETSFTKTTPATTLSPNACQPGWVRSGNKCLAVVGKNQSEWLNWVSARAYCQADGDTSDLASLHSAYEQASVISLLTAELPGVWLGLHTLGGEERGVFGWADNSPVDFTDWAPRQPTSLTDLSARASRFYLTPNSCVEMMTAGNRAGKWKEALCEEFRPFVCQKEPDAASEPDTPDGEGCPDPAMRMFRGDCYLSSAATGNWLQAEAECFSRGGHLASVGGPSEQAFLHTLLHETAKEEDSPPGHWIGLAYGLDSSFRWSDGWPVAYSNWGAGFIPRDLGNRPCTYLDPDSKEWGTANCSQAKPFVCRFTNATAPEVPAAKKGSCPSQDVEWMDAGLQDRCFWVQRGQGTGTPDLTGWDEASALCQTRGGFLSSFHSRQELDQLRPALSGLGPRLWIGLSRKNSGGFEWSDSSAVDFVAWSQSSRANDSETDCVYLDTDDMSWNEIACSSKLGQLCAIFKVPSNETTGNNDEASDRGSKAVVVVGVIFGILCVAIVVALVVRMRQRRSGQPLSFQNLLFRGSGGGSDRDALT